MTPQGRLAVAVMGVILLQTGAVRAQVTRPGLITPARLDSLMKRGDVPLVDVRASWVNYLQRHLPGAVWLNIETLRAGKDELPFQLLSGPQYADLFRRIGIPPKGLVIVYSAGDQLDIDATFVAWLIEEMGNHEVRVLDGGYSRWEQESRILTQDYPRRTRPKGEWPGRRSFHPPLASLADIQTLRRGTGVLVDARPPEQFSGLAGAQRRRGHIPGATSHPWKEDLEVRDLALVWKRPDVLRRGYLQQGITPDKDIVVYCNSGTEASHVLYALRNLLGYPRVRIYAGSWTEWSERFDLPVETSTSP